FTLGAGVWPPAWRLAFIALGLVEMLALYALLRLVGTPRRAATVVTAVFVLVPEVLVYENILTYDYPTLVLVTLSALAVARYARRPTVASGLLVFGAAGSLVLLRTIFEWPWMLLVLALLLAARPGRARPLLVSSSVAVVLVGAVIAKNWIMYGVPSTT